MDRLFVYGTLKRGFGLHHLLVEQGLTFLSVAWVSGQLFDLGSYPAWIPVKDCQDRVEGELYQMYDSQTVLATLDRAEGYVPSGRSLFVREAVRVSPQIGLPCEAWIYRYNGDLSTARRIPSGRFLNPTSH